MDKYYIINNIYNLLDLIVLYYIYYSFKITKFDFYGVCLLCKTYFAIFCREFIICCYEHYTNVIVLFAHYAVNDEDSKVKKHLWFV